MICDFKKLGDGYKCVNCGVEKKRQTLRDCDAAGALGERVADFTKAIGIKPCGGCQKRREALNRATVKVKKFFKKK